MNIKLHTLQIINNEGSPLSHATVAMLNTSGLVIGGDATDSSGYVVLKLKPLTSHIRVSYVGYRNTELKIDDLEDGPIELISISSQLPETEVVASTQNFNMADYADSSRTSMNEKKTSENNVDFSPKLKLNIYPNPSQGQSTLKSDLIPTGTLVNIYSSTDQLVHSVPVLHIKNTEVKLNLPPIHTNDTYTVELIQKNGDTEVCQWIVVR